MQSNNRRKFISKRKFTMYLYERSLEYIIKRKKNARIRPNVYIKIFM